MKKALNKYPKGWNEKKINALMKHYEEQTEDEEVAEDEAAFNDPRQTAVLVPHELLPEIDRLLLLHDSRKDTPVTRRRDGKKDPNRYPRGWNRKKVQALTDYYENQSEDEAAAEIEAAFNDAHATLMLIPRELMAKVNKLLAAHNARKKRPAAPRRKSAGRATRKTAHRRAHAA